MLKTTQYRLNSLYPFQLFSGGPLPMCLITSPAEILVNLRTEMHAMTPAMHLAPAEPHCGLFLEMVTPFGDVWERRWISGRDAATGNHFDTQQSPNTKQEISKEALHTSALSTKLYAQAESIVV